MFKDLNFGILDLQGVELAALNGFGKLFTQLKGIFVEVNRREVYQGGSLIRDIDRLLRPFGGFRQETQFTRASWGDAFYEKQREISSVSRFDYQTKLRIQYLGWAVLETHLVRSSIAAVVEARLFKSSRQFLRNLKHRIVSK